jgi:lysosomal alpha-glucosidase
MSYAHTQQCDQPSDVARFDCHPEDGATQQRCEARKCCWKSPIQHSKSKNLNDISVPYCYYPSDFANYEVTSNVPTDFGQRIQIVKSQTIYIPNEILKLTVDLIYETQQRLRIRIYDPANKRYEVPLQVPIIENKADMTDYNVVINSIPFSIVVTRKSTGVTL